MKLAPWNNSQLAEHPELWTVGGGMTYNLFPATAAEMCCLSSACCYVIRSRCPIRKGCDITTKVSRKTEQQKP